MKSQLLGLADKLEKIASYIEESNAKVAADKEAIKVAEAKKAEEFKAKEAEKLAAKNSEDALKNAPVDSIGQVEIKSTCKQAGELDPIAAFALGE